MNILNLQREYHLSILLVNIFIQKNLFLKNCKKNPITTFAKKKKGDGDGFKCWRNIETIFYIFYTIFIIRYTIGHIYESKRIGKAINRNMNKNNNKINSNDVFIYRNWKRIRVWKKFLQLKDARRVIQLLKMLSLETAI